MLLRRMDVVPDFEIYTRLFRSQRNAYIAGINLFMAFVLWRLLVILGPDAKTKAVPDVAEAAPPAPAPAPTEAETPRDKTPQEEETNTSNSDSSSSSSSDEEGDNNSNAHEKNE